MRFFIIFTLVFCIECPAMTHNINEGKRNDTTALFTNQDLLEPIFERLYQLENSRAWKINIVHIGDSHIQADFLTDGIRQVLQERFGDGGYGFTFPYSLMRTNGSDYIRYSSDAGWKSRLNVSPVSSAVNIGLSGIGLYTNDANFTVQLNANKEHPFNSVKVIYSTKDPQYQISLTKNPITTFVEEKVEDADQVIHRIKRGESLSIIAARYSTTVQALKEENNLKSDNIQAGRTLKIPTSASVKRTQEKVTRRSVDYVDLQSYPYYSSYISTDPIHRISIFSRGKFSMHDINGFVLENDKPGLVYHSIGVNGAKISDFNKYPLFFKQLHILQPDLVILSFGTNESYQKLSADRYLDEMKAMISKVQEGNPNAVILVMTPPPSMLRRRAPNTLIGEYSDALLGLKTFPVWDLYKHMDGQKGIIGKGKYADVIARDKIHYSIGGYRIQGEKFTNDFLKAYQQFKENRQH